mgnify:CR=1 FL=1
MSDDLATTARPVRTHKPRTEAPKSATAHASCCGNGIVDRVEHGDARRTFNPDAAPRRTKETQIAIAPEYTKGYVDITAHHRSCSFVRGNAHTASGPCVRLCNVVPASSAARCAEYKYRRLSETPFQSGFGALFREALAMYATTTSQQNGNVVM